MFLTKVSYQPFVFVADKDYFQPFTGRDHLHSKNLICNLPLLVVNLTSED